MNNTPKSMDRFETTRGKVTRIGEQKVHLALEIPGAEGSLSAAVEQTAADAALLFVSALLENEVEQRVGGRYEHHSGREVYRWGVEKGYMVIAGKKVPIPRPRIRSAEGEKTLECYARLQSEDAMTERVFRQVIAGISTRNYEGVVDGLLDGYGISKSSVSRQWIHATQADLSHMMERRLDDRDLVAIMLDGVGIKEVLLVVALGVDREGRKHVLGLWQGKTENAEVCKALLNDLIERGLDPNAPYLFTVDGAKALTAAIRDIFGKSAQIQRCLQHKRKNILSHLPQFSCRSISKRLSAAWNMMSYKKAKTELLSLVKELDKTCPEAAASLREGLEETLTLHRLHLPHSLRVCLRTTNLIESCFSLVRYFCKNVKRWRSSQMTQRWASSSLLQAEKRMGRIKGYRDIPYLASALSAPPLKARATEAETSSSPVDRKETAA